MRIRTFCFGALLAAFTLSPSVIHSQFQAPTDEELKMTSDPKAPGAAAVYLNVEEIDNDPLHYQAYYERIKVLTEKGKELATVELPYVRGNWKVTDIQGRTIHSDGTIIPLTGKPEDLFSEKSGQMQMGRKVFTLPGVEVGSILEYRYEMRYDDEHFSSPFWDIQRKYFVHQAHYQFTPFKNFQPHVSAMDSTSSYLTDERGRTVNTLIWWKNLPKGADIKTDLSHYTVDVADVLALPDEEWMPPDRNYRYRVFFYYKAASNAVDFWVNEAKFWSKDVDRFAEPTKPIKAVVEGLIAPTDSELDKAKKLYAAVQALDNTDYSRVKGASERKELKLKVAKRADDTWVQKSGSSEDIALLYLAMLRAAGLKAYAAKVVARNQGAFDPSYMSLSQLDDSLVILVTGGKEVVLDPGEKLCPFAQLNWRHAEVRGLRQSDSGLGIMSSPPQPYTENSITRNAAVTIDEHGAMVSADISIAMAGQEALRWRQMALRSDIDEVKKAFDRELEMLVPDGVEAHVDHFLGMDDPNLMLLAVVKANGALGSSTGKRLLLPGFFFETRGQIPFVKQEKRQQQVDMHFAERVTDVVTYHLPDGMTVEGAPAEAKISWPAHAVMAVKSVAKPGTLEIIHSEARGFSTAKPEEYGDLRGFYQKVAAANQQQLVLTSATVAKGN